MTEQPPEPSSKEPLDSDDSKDADFPPTEQQILDQSWLDDDLDESF